MYGKYQHRFQKGFLVCPLLKTTPNLYSHRNRSVYENEMGDPLPASQSQCLFNYSYSSLVPRVRLWSHYEGDKWPPDTYFLTEAELQSSKHSLLRRGRQSSPIASE